MIKELTTSQGVVCQVKVPAPVTVDDHYMIFIDKKTQQEIARFDMNYLAIFQDLVNGTFND